MPDLIELLKNASKVAEYQTKLERLRAENEQLKAVLAKAQQPTEASGIKTPAPWRVVDVPGEGSILRQGRYVSAMDTADTWLKGRGANVRRRFP